MVFFRDSPQPQPDSLWVDAYLLDTSAVFLVCAHIAQLSAGRCHRGGHGMYSYCGVGTTAKLATYLIWSDSCFLLLHNSAVRTHLEGEGGSLVALTNMT